MSAIDAIPSLFVPSAKIRRRQRYYSIKDGNWNDPTIWLSNKAGTFPGADDDVYISHVVTANIVASVYNLYGNGTLKCSNAILSVFGDLQLTGTLDMTASNATLYLYGITNYVINYLQGTSSIIGFFRYGDQPIMPLDYCTLYVLGGIKSLQKNTTLSKDLWVGDIGGVDFATFDLVTTGATTFWYWKGSQARTWAYKTGPGNLTFQGVLNSYSFANGMDIDFRGGNPVIEFKKGFLLYQWTYYLGTGTMSLTTANQDIQGVVDLQNPITIAAGIEVSVVNSYKYLKISNSINGSSSTSKLINKGTGLYINTVNVMSTGVFDVTSFTNTVTYAPNLVIPFSAYSSLSVNDGCTRTGNLTMAGDLSIYGSFTVTDGDLEVDGYLNVFTNASSKLYKNGTGNILLKNRLTLYAAMSFLDFSGGNPNVEIQSGGINYYINNWKTGTGTFKFTTNNQDLVSGGTSCNGMQIHDCRVSVSGAITITVQPTQALSLQFNSDINGDNASSTFRNNSIVDYQSAIRPMITGILDCNNAANTFRYNRVGDQDVTGGTYRTLEFGGSGIKTLQGNVVVNTTAGGSWSITGSASINYNGYTITTI